MLEIVERSVVEEKEGMTDVRDGIVGGKDEEVPFSILGKKLRSMMFA